MSVFSKKSDNNFNIKEEKIAEVIKNNGLGELLIWKHPEEDFNVNSTLLVMPGEKAIFIKSGIVEQVFENGRYKLSTENYPFLSRLRRIFTGGVSTFNCIIYFVRIAHSVEINWGTTSPIQVRDKLLGIATKLRCRGTYKVAIDNPVKFLEKLIGNNIPFQFQEELDKYFVDEFQSKIKSIIAKSIEESNKEILGIDSRLDELSEMIQPHLQEILDDYGLRCAKFSVSAIDIDDDELRKRYDTIGMDGIATVRKAQSDRVAMDILGNDWQKQQTTDILKTLANKETNNPVSPNLGMELVAGNIFKEMAKDTFSSTSSKSNSTETDPIEVLTKLKKMLDSGLIEKEEYDIKKKEILERM